MIATGYAACPDCGHEFPPPERQKHEATASAEGILSGQAIDTEYHVQDIYYSVHTKRGADEDAPKTMRVDYRVGLDDFRSEWVCPEHTGWARQKFIPWWTRRSNDPIPATAQQAVAPGLLDRLVVETSQSGGWHAVYRRQNQIGGSMKLAQRKQPVSPEDIYTREGREYVRFFGKEYAVRTDPDGGKYIIVTLIETRGNGGLFLCDPTPGYELVQGSLTDPPVLTEPERETLLQAAWELNEYVPEPVGGSDTPYSTYENLDTSRPGDEFNQRGDVRAILRAHGWALSRTGENEQWRRPGKRSGCSATLKDGVFYVFSTNAAPFEHNRAYSPFAVYTLLEHGGDYAAASSALRQRGFGQEQAEQPGVDISMLVDRAVSKLENARDSPQEDKKLRFTGITSKELAENKYELSYLVDGRLVRSQPGMIAGPKKTLKTNTSIDLALAMSQAGLFLGRFNVPEAVRVGIMSGESGAATIQETARRIARAKYTDLARFNNVIWSFDIPQLGQADHTEALRQFILDHELEVLILDPTYLMMMGVGNDAGNMFVVGGLLKSPVSIWTCWRSTTRSWPTCWRAT
ncbi:MAG TPA: AAA family ATPase [Thermoguttaceae bacterium]|nr:AAA family ATPase [Thermoguttaceae bacterium]